MLRSYRYLRFPTAPYVRRHDKHCVTSVIDLNRRIF